MRSSDSEVAGEPAMSSFESEIGEAESWFASPRFEGRTLVAAIAFICAGIGMGWKAIRTARGENVA